MFFQNNIHLNPILLHRYVEISYKIGSDQEWDVNLLKSKSSSATKWTLRRGKHWFPKVEDSPSVCSTNEMRWNIFMICAWKLGHCSWKHWLDRARKTSVNKNVEGYTDTCTALFKPHGDIWSWTTSTQHHFSLREISIHYMLPGKSQLVIN